MNILLTSAGRRGYLVTYFKEALVRAGCGGKVHAANSSDCAAFEYADRAVLAPLIYDREYIPFLLDYCKENRIDLLLPLFDVDVPVLAAAREEFASVGTTVVTADRRGAEICNDKWQTYRQLKDAGFCVPAAWIDPEEALHAVREGGAAWPLIVKPRWGMGSLGIYAADDEESLRVFLTWGRKQIRDSYMKYEAAKDESRSMLIQEYLNGQEYGLDVMNDLEGNVRGVSVRKKLAMRAGETDSAVTAEDPELMALGWRLGEFLRHRGNLDVDVIASGGRNYVLEMNARFGGGYPFSHAAGVDLPQALVLWALGREPDPAILAARPGIMARKDICIRINSIKGQ